MSKNIKKITPEMSKKMVEIVKNSTFLQEKLDEVKAIMSKVKTA